MYYEIMTKHKTKLELSPYKEDIKVIFNSMMNEGPNYEYYNIYKESYELFVYSLLDKLHVINTPIIHIEEYITDGLDKTIFVKYSNTKPKTIIELMKKI